MALLLFVLCIHADAARVTLKDGRIFDGKILSRTNDSVMVEDAAGVRAEIPNSIIENIEGADKGLGHGVFTYALLQGLNGAADGADGDKSGSIEAEELKNFIRGEVPELMKRLYGVEQYPVTYGVSYGGLGGLGPTLVTLP